MKRLRSVLLPAAVLLLTLSTDCRMTQKTESMPSSEKPDIDKQHDPLSIHRRAIAIDMHADTTQRLVDEKVDLTERLPDGHFDTLRAKEGGLDAQFFSIWVEPELFGGGGSGAMKRA